ncbi:MAG: aminoacyl-tRNA hydrolase [Myxococcales bacterium]|nr:aminoacyl-tRNA hydrolase [Myxococcales bacterium]
MVVGLGNPGQKYRDTRHNVGVMVVDHLAQRASCLLSDKKFNALGGRGRLVGEDILFLKPQTYMNRSGTSVGPALGFHKLPTDQLIVVHDELDKPFGHVNLKEGGGHRGHNGVRSIKQHVPDDNFARVRVGIGRPPPEWEAADYVLSRFSAEEQLELDRVIGEAADVVELILRDGVARAAAAHKERTQGPRRSKTAG